MENELWKERVAPPADGLSRLRSRLDQAERASRRETLVLGTVTGALAAALILVVSIGRPSSELLPAGEPSGDMKSGGLMAVNGQAAQMPGTPPGVHYYWIFR